ncbi:OmpP1/FadL family transporter [Acinetobacter equi]|uniref:Transporter n=1 Tax=Acinetobacter equi TaxID=1324350 RepID=A0A0N9VXU5_9GAMM|nr:transporter [Acinetobacter equi]ALH94126.1 transporter [Acinetobacter equi]
MKLKKLYIALSLSTLSFSSIAAGLDRSGQSISAFLQPGNYAEAGFHLLDPSVKGTDNNGKTVADMGESYYFPTAAIKVQATDQISLGLLYDQPYGGDATYQVDGSDFSETALNEGTKVKVRTNNITALIGYQPTENWNIYAGPVWQTVEADISLRGVAYGGLSALGTYDIDVKQKEAYGWVAGFAYQIPEIALKASVTYRSEIKHKATATETTRLPVPTFSYMQDTLEAVTPQSVNIDLQTGIAPNTLAFTNVRWVHWDQFTVSPTLLGNISEFATQNRQDLISYSKDQWSITSGIGHKFSDKWSGTALVAWDSGAGNPITVLGPTKGYWAVGAGGQYSPAEDYFIQAGMKYFWLGDADAQTGGAIRGKFTNNHALGYSLKIGYRF